MSFLYRVAGFVLHPFLGRFGRLAATGLDKLPPSGFVLVSNHVGWIDPLWIGLALWPRPVCPMAKKELFANPVAAYVLDQLGAFPVTRGAPTPREIRRPIDILHGGGVVIIFPGGRREVQVSSVKRGAATIALAAAVPVVPVHFQGPGTLAWRNLFRRPAATVRIGAPIYFDESVPANGAERKDRIRAAVAAIEAGLGEMASG